MRVRRNASCAMPRACTRKIVKDQVRRQPRELPVHRPRRHDGRLGASDGEARRRHETTVSGHCPTGRGRQPRGRRRRRLLGRRAITIGRALRGRREARRDTSTLLRARVERHVERRRILRWQAMGVTIWHRKLFLNGSDSDTSARVGHSCWHFGRHTCAPTAATPRAAAAAAAARTLVEAHGTSANLKRPSAHA